MRIVDLRWVNIRALTVVVSGPKFTNFVFNSRVILDNAIESCPTSRWILDVFWIPKF